MIYKNIFSFELYLAMEAGLEEAIFLTVMKDMADKDGWVEISREDLHEVFPFWTEHQLRRITASLVKGGYLETAHRKENKYDRTLSYRIV